MVIVAGANKRPCCKMSVLNSCSLHFDHEHLWPRDNLGLYLEFYGKLIQNGLIAMHSGGK